MSESLSREHLDLVVASKPGVSLAELAATLSAKHGKLIIAARVGGEVTGLSTILEEENQVEFLTFDSPEARQIYRHTAAHVMAHAVKSLFPDAKLGIGPAIEDGFYYDFDVGGRLTEDMLPEIEKKMAEIVAKDIPLERIEISRNDALKKFEELGEIYKVELLNEMTEEKVTLYRQDDFIDLCRGPHLPSTGYVRAFKLTGLAGAYWRGDENRPMLQRIYGTAYETQDALQAHLERLEEAKRRDHRRLGIDLDLYTIDETAGAGLVYWHPKGSVVRRIIEDFWKDEHTKRGYHLVYTPHIARADLWKTSGHFDYYRDNMYVFEVEDDEYVLKPMNCVGHILIYKSRKRSYRELPLRFAELGTVYRRERSGTLHGLMRVRGFTQDDAHIFCMREQIADEISGVVQLAEYMLKVFGFDTYEVDLSVRDPNTPERYAGSDEDWHAAETSLADVLKSMRIPFRRCEGEAVFYGPKIDIKLLDALGRGWQGPTVQFDFNLPRRLGVEYVGSDGHSHYVVMIHRTVLGALERFMGVLIEHYAGAFPLWLAPVQVAVLPVLEGNEGYAADLVKKLSEKGIRAELVGSDQKLGYRIRAKSMEKVPYIVIVGNKEEEDGSVSVRKRKHGDLGSMPSDQFMNLLQSEIIQRSP